MQDQEAMVQTKLQDMMKLAIQQQPLIKTDDIQSENTKFNKVQPVDVPQQPSLPIVGELESPPVEQKEQKKVVDATRLVTPLDLSKLNTINQNNQVVDPVKIHTTTDLLA